MKVYRDCVGGEVYGNLSVLKLLYVYFRRHYTGETREMLNAFNMTLKIDFHRLYMDTYNLRMVSLNKIFR